MLQVQPSPHVQSLHMHLVFGQAKPSRRDMVLDSRRGTHGENLGKRRGERTRQGSRGESTRGGSGVGGGQVAVRVAHWFSRLVP